MSNSLRINPPTRTTKDAAYLQECEFALEPSVRGLMKLATAAGWEPKQAATAIAVLSIQIAESKWKMDA